MKTCDRCGVESLITVRSPRGYTLDWCGHHYREYAMALLAAHWTITEDKRETANA